MSLQGLLRTPIGGSPATATNSPAKTTPSKSPANQSSLESTPTTTKSTPLHQSPAGPASYLALAGAEPKDKKLPLAKYLSYRSPGKGRGKDKKRQNGKHREDKGREGGDAEGGDEAETRAEPSDPASRKDLKERGERKEADDGNDEEENEDPKIHAAEGSESGKGGGEEGREAVKGGMEEPDGRNGCKGTPKRKTRGSKWALDNEGPVKVPSKKALVVNGKKDEGGAENDGVDETASLQCTPVGSPAPKAGFKSPKSLGVKRRAGPQAKEAAEEGKEEAEASGPKDMEIDSETENKEEAKQSVGSPPEGRKRKRKPAVEKEPPLFQLEPPKPLASPPKPRKRSAATPKKASPVKALLVFSPKRGSSLSEAGPPTARGDARESNEEVTAGSPLAAGNSQLPAKLRNKQKALFQQGQNGSAAEGGKAEAKGLSGPGVGAGERERKPAHCPHAPNGLHPASSVKARLAHALSSSKLRRWCQSEWLYSALDLPWFARNEFVEYLHHAGLGHVHKLTRAEWAVIRSSLGKPRRLSKKFLEEERRKLGSYRDAARRHYRDLRDGSVDALWADLARPLSVGQRVTAKHPRTRQLHDGSILTVDWDKCRVQFDRPELGVELVQDIDMMPLNPSENLPEILRGPRRLSLDARSLGPGFEGRADSSLGLRSNSLSSAGGLARAALNEKLERPAPPPPASISGPHQTLASPLLSTLAKRAQVLASQSSTLESVSLAKAAAREALASAQQAVAMAAGGSGAAAGTPLGVPVGGGTSSLRDAREQDVKVLLDLTNVLDKKEKLLAELRRLNETADASQAPMPVADSSGTSQRQGLRATENFQRQHALLTGQVKDTDKQIESAVTKLRQRIQYEQHFLGPANHTAGYAAAALDLCSAGQVAGYRAGGQAESGVPIGEMTATVRRHARAMVASILQAMASTKDGEAPLPHPGQALEAVPFPATLASHPSHPPHVQQVASLPAAAAALSSSLEPPCGPQSPGRDPVSMHSETNRSELESSGPALQTVTPSKAAPQTSADGNPPQDRSCAGAVGCSTAGGPVEPPPGPETSSHTPGGKASEFKSSEPTPENENGANSGGEEPHAEEAKGNPGEDLPAGTITPASDPDGPKPSSSAPVPSKESQEEQQAPVSSATSGPAPLGTSSQEPKGEFPSNAATTSSLPLPPPAPPLPAVSSFSSLPVIPPPPRIPPLLAMGSLGSVFAPIVLEVYGGNGNLPGGRGMGRKPAVPEDPLVGIGDLGAVLLGGEAGMAPRSYAKEAGMLSELMASSLATLLMIQNCADQKLRDSDVVLVLDSALASLMPYASQNNRIYKEIEASIITIKKQIMEQLPASFMG